MGGKNFYAVKRGNIPGVYGHWYVISLSLKLSLFTGSSSYRSEAADQVNGVSGSVHKGFRTLNEAIAFMDAPGLPLVPPPVEGLQHALDGMHLRPGE